MQDPEILLDSLKSLIKQKKSKFHYSQKLGVSVDVIEELLNMLRKSKKDVKSQDIKKEEKSSKTEDYRSDGTASLEYKGNKSISSLEEAIDFFKIDTSIWEIERWVCNSWDVGSKWREQDLSWSNGVMDGYAKRENEWITHTNYQIKVWLKKKKSEDYTPEDFAKFLAKWEPSRFYREVRCFPSTIQKEWVDVELNIADFHLAKKTFEGDTLASKEFDYYKVVDDLVSKINGNYKVNKLVFPISNDFFHTDNYQNSTTNGTPQDVTAWYDEEYEKGFDILANTINYLLTQAKEVEVILVQGNHDRTKGFFVAHALEVFFKGYKNINFQREHSVTKSVVLGNTFIGYHHGNSVKLENLPLVFATGKDASAFGNAKYREIHTGDKHHYMAKEIQGVRIQQMPSLSKTDRWHRDNNFENKIHAALAIVYHPENGKTAEFEVRL